MNRAFIFQTTLAVMIFLGGQSIAKTQKPSEEMALILIHHKSGPHDLSAKGLSEDKAKAIPSKAEMPEYEVYDVPFPKNLADAFGYTVYLHNKSRRYWIFRCGGISPKSLFYGPGLVKDLRN